MDYRKLYNRYKQFGGLRLVREYARLGLLWPITKAFFRCLLKRESFKRIYPEMLKKVEPFLKKRYEGFLQTRKDYSTGLTFEHRRNEIIWFCWLQGLENAPEIVKTCYGSLKLHLTDRGIKVIDNYNRCVSTNWLSTWAMKRRKTKKTFITGYLPLQYKWQK